MKLATSDLSGAANCSGASCARCPRVVKGVMSCSRLAGSRPLCRGWTNTNTFHWLFYAGLNEHSIQVAQVVVVAPWQNFGLFLKPDQTVPKYVK